MFQISLPRLTVSCLVAGSLVLPGGASAETAAAAVAEPAADEVLPPHIILSTQRAPEYPPAALAGRFNGSVMLEALVLADGTVGDVQVLSCTRPKVGFEDAVIDAVKSWQFEPGRKNGEPVEFTLKFRLNFTGGRPGEVPRVSAGSFVTVPATADGDVAEGTGPASTRGASPAPSRPRGGGGRP
jgi:TonB family protein